MLKARFFILSTGIFAIALGGIQAPHAHGQEADPKYRLLPLDPAGDKRKKEKDDLLNPEKFDVAKIDAYYQENLLPRLLQANADSMNSARTELMTDVETIERKSRGTPKMLDDYNKMLSRLLNDVISGKDANGQQAHPSSRIIAAVIAGRLNRQAGSNQGPLPDPEGTKTLLRIFTPTENDGMVATALTHLPRHWSWPGMDATLMEQARKRFVSNAEAFLGAQKPAARGEEEESYLRELLMDNLTIIADGESESANAARSVLLPLIQSSVQKFKQESEWLVETAIHSFGQLTKPEIKPEELVEFEVDTVKFLQSSLRSWNRRCAQTTASAGKGMPGAGGYPGGPGGGGPGAGGFGGSGGMFGGDEGGGKSGEGGRPGAGGGAPKSKNPYDEQPKEVKIARRILQQRLEKVHYGLNGFGKTNPGEPTKGIVALAADDRKEKLNELIAAIDALQKALNDDKVKGLDTLVNSTRAAVTDLQAACDAIVGSDGQVDLPVDAGSTESGESDSESTGGDFGGDSGK